jgi:hypothetical protein
LTFRLLALVPSLLDVRRHADGLDFRQLQPALVTESEKCFTARVCHARVKPLTRRLLARVAEETAAGNSPKSPPVRKAETRTILVREWQGDAHRVTMLRDGVSFN